MITPYARRLIAIGSAATAQRPAVDDEWRRRSGSGMRLAETRVCYAPRKSGVAWLVRFRGRIVAESTGPESKDQAHEKALTLCPRFAKSRPRSKTPNRCHHSHTPSKAVF